MLNDLRYALRTLRHNPGFALVAIIVAGFRDWGQRRHFQPGGILTPAAPARPACFRSRGCAGAVARGKHRLHPASRFVLPGFH